MSVTWGSAANEFCMLCGEREGKHSAWGNKCPNPRGAEIGQPLYLDQKFVAQVPKGRAKFKPAHFGQRTR